MNHFTYLVHIEPEFYWIIAHTDLKTAEAQTPPPLSPSRCFASCALLPTPRLERPVYLTTIFI